MASSTGHARFLHVRGDHVGPENGTVEFPFNTISEAVAVAQEGDYVRVAAGPGLVYAECVHLDKPVHLQGGFDPLRWERRSDGRFTVLDGQGQDTVLIIGPWASDEGSMIEGFLIQNGQGMCGGGIRIEGASPQLRDNRISGNGATDLGGGICVLGGEPRLERTIIEGNVALGQGGGGVYAEGAVELQGNRLFANEAPNGKGGALFIASQTHATLLGNRLVANLAQEGAGLAIGAGARLTAGNESIYLNTALERGGGLQVTAAEIDLTNVTIVSNTAPSAPGILALGISEHLALTNCIVWGHKGRGLVGQGFKTRYSNIEDQLYPGPGNTSLRPRWDPLGTGTQLSLDSPLIDAGWEGMSLRTDIQGQPRRYDGNGDGHPGVDVGADEVAAMLESSRLEVLPGSFPVAGGTIRYRIALGNTGQLDVRQATLTATLSAGLVIDPASLSATAGVYDLQQHGLTWYGPLPVTLSGQDRGPDIMFEATLDSTLQSGQWVTYTARVAYGAAEPWLLHGFTEVRSERLLYFPRLLRRQVNGAAD